MPMNVLLKTLLVIVCLQINHATADVLEEARVALSEVLTSAQADAQPVALLVRHALAPGTGDPVEFSLDDCSTQRNLSAEGRQQAVNMGELFRDSSAGTNIDAISVFSSAWCRCQETAELLQLGPVSTLASLNSFFADMSTRQDQTDQTQEWLLQKLAAVDKATPPHRIFVLVTHQVNITALTGVYPSSGEMVVVRAASPSQLEVVKQIRTD